MDTEVGGHGYGAASSLATIVVEPNMSTSNRYNFVNSTPIWTIPSALETGEKRATFYRDNLKVRDMKLKQKEEIKSQTVR